MVQIPRRHVPTNCKFVMVYHSYKFSKRIYFYWISLKMCTPCLMNHPFPFLFPPRMFQRPPSTAYIDSHHHRLLKGWRQPCENRSYPRQLKLRPRLSLSGGFRFRHDYLYNQRYRPYLKPQPRVRYPVSQIILALLLRVCKLHWDNSM